MDTNYNPTGSNDRELADGGGIGLVNNQGQNQLESQPMNVFGDLTDIFDIGGGGDHYDGDNYNADHYDDNHYNGDQFIYDQQTDRIDEDLEGSIMKPYDFIADQQ